MAKEPGSPPGGDKTPDPRDARAEHWEATFFSPDGEAIGEQAAQPSAPQQTPSGSAVPEPIISDDSEVDSEAAFDERVSHEASASVDQHVDDLGDALQEKFMHLLNTKIAETGGTLSAEDVQELGEEFKNNLEDIKETFLKAVESYTLARERRRVESARDNYFARLMVRKFEHRFRNESELQNQPEFLSRRILPGFNSMLAMMFGKPQMASYEKRVRAIAERLKNENNGELDWEQFYRSPDVKKLALRAEIEIAQNFKDVDKRTTWMVAMINSNLIPADDKWAGAEWTFNEAAASKLLSSLFGDLRSALKNPNARDRFSGTLGAEIMQTLDGVAARFQ